MVTVDYSLAPRHKKGMVSHWTTFEVFHSFATWKARSWVRSIPCLASHFVIIEGLRPEMGLRNVEWFLESRKLFLIFNLLFFFQLLMLWKTWTLAAKFAFIKKFLDDLKSRAIDLFRGNFESSKVLWWIIHITFLWIVKESSEPVRLLFIKILDKLVS